MARGETVTQIDHKDTPCWCSDAGRDNKHPDKEQHHPGCTQYEESYPNNEPTSGNVMKVMQDPAEEETLCDMLDIVAGGGSFAATPECETYRTLACKLLGALQEDGVDTDKYPVEDEN